GQVPRHEMFVHAFGVVGVSLVLVEDAGLFVLLEHRPVGVDAPHFDLRFALLEVLPDARHRPPGPDADDEVCDAAAGLLPDFRTRLLVVRLRVRQVVVLVRLPRVRDLALEARRHRVVRSRILRLDVRRAHDHFRAERFQRVDLLFRLLVGRRENAVIALDDAGDGEPHAGVAGSALDDRAARLQLPCALGVLDHFHRHAVLDRVAGVERFDLDEDGAFDDAFRDPFDAHHRSVAVCVEYGAADPLHEYSLYFRAPESGFGIGDLGFADHAAALLVVSVTRRTGAARQRFTTNHEPRTPTPNPKSRIPNPEFQHAKTHRRAGRRGRRRHEAEENRGVRGPGQLGPRERQRRADDVTVRVGRGRAAARVRRDHGRVAGNGPRRVRRRRVRRTRGDGRRPRARRVGALQHAGRRRRGIHRRLPACVFNGDSTSGLIASLLIARTSQRGCRVWYARTSARVTSPRYWLRLA